MIEKFSLGGFVLKGNLQLTRLELLTLWLEASQIWSTHHFRWIWHGTTLIFCHGSAEFKTLLDDAYKQGLTRSKYFNERINYIFVQNCFEIKYRSQYWDDGDFYYTVMEREFCHLSDELKTRLEKFAFEELFAILWQVVKSDFLQLLRSHPENSWWTSYYSFRGWTFVLFIPVNQKYFYIKKNFQKCFIRTDQLSAFCPHANPESCWHEGLTNSQ